MKKIINPMAFRDSSDPYMTYDKETGYYYCLFSEWEYLKIYRSRHAANILRDNDFLVIRKGNGDNSIYGNIWAPEMYKAENGLWYLYSSSTYQQEFAGKRWAGEKRLFVLESNTHNPFDGFYFKNRLDDSLFAIDPTVYKTKDGKLLMCYSRVVENQVLEIREMVNPYTLGDKRAIIAEPTFSWELFPAQGTWMINEGAFFVENGNKLFIVYSYNGAFNDDYGLAILEYLGGDYCDKKSWKKLDKPFFTKGNGIYGPGHASFFRSPDGTELWCAYHGMNHHNETEEETERYMNIQKIDFDENGYPKATIPVGWGVEMDAPSGEDE